MNIFFIRNFCFADLDVFPAKPQLQEQVQAPVQIPRSTRLIPCRYGSECRSYKDAEHRAKYSHPAGIENKDNRIPCRYGAECHDSTNYHCTKYSHP